MQSEPGQCFLFPGDQSIYSLKCICCQRSITATGSIGQTLYHAPIAMLHHWDMIVTEDDATVDTPFADWLRNALFAFHQKPTGEFC